jgi:hypothetical protein
MIGMTAVAFSSDTLYFYNGNLLIGELKKIELGKIQFDADGVGVVNIKYDKIRTLKADKHSYRIETADQRLFYGTIDTSFQWGYVTIYQGGEPYSVQLAAISTLSTFEKRISAMLKGKLGVGYSYARASRIGRFNLNAETRLASRSTELLFSGNSMITRDSVETYREREQMQLSGLYWLKNRWYAGCNITYQRNRELGLKSRWQQGVGIGYKFLQRKQLNAKSITGIVFNSEQNYADVRNTFFELAFQTKFNFFSFSEPNINLGTTQTFYASLSQRGRYRLDGDLSLDWELFKDFTLNLSFYHNYDSRSPGTDQARLDYGFVMGISYNF